jgi:hypothetical protein
MGIQIWILDWHYNKDKTSITKIIKVRKGNAIDFNSFLSSHRYENGIKVVRDCQAWYPDDNNTGWRLKIVNLQKCLF